MMADRLILDRAQNLSALKKHLVLGQFSFYLIFIGHHLGSTFTGTDRNGPNYQIGPDCAGVHSCNSWFSE